MYQYDHWYLETLKQCPRRFAGLISLGYGNIAPRQTDDLACTGQRTRDFVYNNCTLTHHCMYHQVVEMASYKELAEQYRAQLEKLITEHHTTELGLAKLTQQVIELENVVQEYDGLVQTFRNATSLELADAAPEMVNLRREYEDLCSKASPLRSENEELRLENDHLRRANDDIKRTDAPMEAAEKTHHSGILSCPSTVARELEEAKITIATLRTELADATFLKDNAETKHAQVLAMEAALRKQIANANKAADKAEKTLASKSITLENSQSRVKTLEANAARAMLDRYT